MIELEFGVAYHKGHVSRLLKELYWTPQTPIRRAIQRDEAAIERWRSVVWPELVKQARGERRVWVFVDESGFYLLPGVVKTHSPEGQTPVLREKLTRDHLSVMAGMTPEAKIYTLARQESLNGLHRIAFLVPLNARGRETTAGDLGRFPDPPSMRGDTVCVEHARPSSAGGSASLCPRPRPVG